MKLYNFKIKPVPKPRMTRSDAWKKRPCVMRYWEYKDELNKIAKEIDYQLKDTLNIIYMIPFPESYPKNKREELFFRPHQLKPDIDNLTKAFLDCLTKDDSNVWSINETKIWSYDATILVSEIEKGEEAACYNTSLQRFLFDYKGAC